MPLSEAIGTFIFLGTFALLVTRAFEYEANRKRVRRMRDAQLEMQWNNARFRGETDEY
jgi:hypothetical protein